MTLAQRTTVAFAVLGLLGAGVTGGVVLKRHRDDLHSAIVANHALLAENRALAIREGLVLAVDELVRLSKLAALDPAEGDAPEMQRAFRQAYRQTPFFDARMELVDPEGHCLLAEPPSAPCADHGGDPWFQEARTARAPRLFTFDEGHGVRLDAVVPIRDGEGRLHAALRGELALDGGVFELPTHARLPPDTDVRLVDAEGRVVFHDGEVHSTAWDLALGAEVRGARILDADGRRYLVASAPIDDTEMRLVFVWDWSTLDVSAEQRTVELLWLVFLIAMVALAVGVAMARQLSRPLTELTREAQRATADGRPSIGPAKGDDEVAELRRAFAALVEALTAREAEARALAATLETRVQERTADLEETRDALVQAERLATVGRAGAVLSHELRNSLNAISVAIDALGGSSLTPEAQAKVRGAARAEIARLRSLSDTMLRTTSPVTPRRRSHETREVVERALLLVEDEAREREVTLEHSIEDGSLAIDADLMVSVLTNLLHNAVQAAARGSGGKVRIMSRVDGCWEVVVEDDGPGVPDEVREHLFEPFATGRVGGVGLGLAVAQRFVQLHGGTIALETSELGGARFHFELPLPEGGA